MTRQQEHCGEAVRLLALAPIDAARIPGTADSTVIAQLSAAGHSSRPCLHVRPPTSPAAPTRTTPTVPRGVEPMHSTFCTPRPKAVS